MTGQKSCTQVSGWVCSGDERGSKTPTGPRNQTENLCKYYYYSLFNYSTAVWSLCKKVCS